MNNINGINGYGGPNAIGPSGRQGPNPGKPAAQAVKGGDQVEISPVAHYLQKIAMLPEIRLEKVNPIKHALAEGTYDIEGKLPRALDMLLDEYTQE